MKTSATINFLCEALLESQKEIGNLEKDAQNPFFKSSYSSLTEIMNSVKPVLNKHQLMILQPVQIDRVVTRLQHISGEWMEDEGVEIKNAKEHDPQAQGSAISYAKRYGIQSLLGLVSEDDDGEAAMNRDKQVSTPRPIQHGKPANAVSDRTKHCTIHDVDVYEFAGKTPGKTYFAHKDAEGKLCFVN